MKNGILTRPVDTLGRIVIPIEIRNKLGIAAKDTLDIYVEDEQIILSKSGISCFFCGNEKIAVEFKGKPICKRCLNELAKKKAE